MDTVLIVTRVALTGIFLVAAVAKLADMPGSRSALEGFGVPARLLAPAAVALPLAELTAAGLLIPRPTVQAGAALALLLLLAFVLGIVTALRRGHTPDCHCFGQIHSRPAGRETILRNLIIAAVALFVAIAGPGPWYSDWGSSSSGVLIALAGTSLLAVLLAYAAATLWQQTRRLTGRGRGPALAEPIQIGEPVPDFTISTMEGERLRAAELLDGRRTILVFISATCGPCLGLLPELTRWSAMLADRLAIRIVASGDERENRRLSDEHDTPFALDPRGEASSAMGVYATPSAVQVDAEGRVMSPPAAGAPAIEGLIRTALKQPESEEVELRVRQVAGSPASDAST